MADRIGQQLGNYRLIRLLGQGGLVTTYLGEHVLLGTQAAIKVFQTQLAPVEQEDFFNEERIIANLDHPHIVRIFDFGIENNIPYSAVTYAPNGTLRQRHPKGSILPLATVVSYVRQVADALQYLHDHRIIHRDIKPENMLLGPHNEVLLSDFGIAIIAAAPRAASLKTQEVTGTVAYMAPEQIQGRPRPASDQYSLGIVVCEWLSGDRPFGGTFNEIAFQHLSVPPPSLSRKNPSVPPLVEEVVMIALAKDPDKRFRSVRAFANALEQASQPSPSAQMGSSLPPQAQVGGTSPAQPGTTHTTALPPPQPQVQASGTSPAQQQQYGSVPPATGDLEDNRTEDSGTFALPTVSPKPSPDPNAGNLLPAPPPPYSSVWANPGSLTPPYSPPPLKSSRSGLSSLFSAAGDALEKVFSGRGRRRRKEFQLSLFAIARAVLEEEDRAFVGKSYTVQAGIAQSKPENFAGEPFNLSVQSLEPLLFDVLLHTSENIEPVKEWHKRLRYDPRNPNPQLVEFTFRTIAPGQSSLVINFYRERRWLKTLRFEFDAIEKSMLTAVSSRG